MESVYRHTYIAHTYVENNEQVRKRWKPEALITLVVVIFFAWLLSD